jgi:P27 family predicted phage terminase small subunit
MGRPRKPDVIKDLEGNPGRRQSIHSIRACGVPVMPAYLKGYARETWDRVIGAMPEALYAACDVDLLAAYCQAAKMLKHSTEKLGEEAEFEEINGWTRIQARQAQLIKEIGARLGLDPVARASIAMPPEPKKSKFEGLISIAGGRKPSSTSSSSSSSPAESVEGKDSD